MLGTDPTLSLFMTLDSFGHGQSRAEHEGKHSIIPVSVNPIPNQQLRRASILPCVRWLQSTGGPAKSFFWLFSQNFPLPNFPLLLGTVCAFSEHPK